MVEPNKKLAVVLQSASTGGWRYLTRLVGGLRRQRPGLQVTCYLGRSINVLFGDNDDPVDLLESTGAIASTWPDLPEPPPANKFRPIRKWRYAEAQKDFQKWLRHFEEYDAVFFAWPYWMECPDLRTRLYFIPHDFNYLHFMGAFNMAPADAQRQKLLHADWLRRATPIVSSQFIADELKRGFPAYSGSTHVIPLSRLSVDCRMHNSQAAQQLAKLGVEGDYLLSVNNTAYHKNIGQLLSAFHYVLERHPNLKLVLVGHNTDGASGLMRTPWYVDVAERTHTSQVISFGMRNNDEVTALMQGARMVINPSLYEAGNGSGLDAWALGTPVVMSDIPPFREHLTTLGVQAELFHPRCCFSIRDAICRVLEDASLAASMVATSRSAMERYDWLQVADQYLRVFEL